MEIAGTRRRRRVPLPEWYDELDTAPSVARFCESTVLTKRIASLRIRPKVWRIVSCESADSDAALLNCSVGTKRLSGDKSRSLSFCCSHQSDARP